MTFRLLATGLLVMGAGCANRSVWDFSDEQSPRVSKQYHRSHGREPLDPEMGEQLDAELEAQETPEHRAQTE